MKTENPIPSNESTTDLHGIANAAKKLGTAAIKLGGFGFRTTVLQWVASVAAMYFLPLYLSLV